MVAVEGGFDALCLVHWVIVSGGLAVGWSVAGSMVVTDVLGEDVFFKNRLDSMTTSRNCTIILPVVIHTESDDPYSQNLRI